MKKLYIWKWVGGGWNYCEAQTQEEAWELACKVSILTPLKESLHETTWDEINRMVAITS